MKQFLMIRQSDGVVFGTALQDDPDTGPIKPQQQAQEGFDLVPFDGEFSREGKDGCVATWDGSAVVWSAEMPAVRALHVERMRVACEQQIVAGFMCAALGEAHLYPAKVQDQANLIASVTDSLMAGDDPAWRTQFWCADAAGAWEFRDHTVAQIQQVGKTGKAAILAAMGKNELLRRQIEAASTAAQIEAITW
jgi:hypothetical protein